MRQVRYQIENGHELDAAVVREYKTEFHPRDAQGQPIPGGEYVLQVVDLVAILPADLPKGTPGVTPEQRAAGFLHVKAVLEGKGLYRWHDPRQAWLDVPSDTGAGGTEKQPKA